MHSTPPNEPHTIIDRPGGENGTLAERIFSAYKARWTQAEEEYSTRGVRKMYGPCEPGERDFVGDGIFHDTVCRFAGGVDPQWLIRAKQFFAELGACIYAVSRRETMPPEGISEAETFVREVVNRLPGEAGTSRLDIATFNAVVAMVATRHEAVVGPLDAGQAPEDAVCFAYSCHDVFLAMRLAEHREEIALLLTRWHDTTPRKPTKWQIAAKILSAVRGEQVLPETVRRNDPAKKQPAPGTRKRNPSKAKKNS